MRKLLRAEFIFLIISVLFSTFFIFYNLGATHLIEYDEGIYALVAKNILKSGDWFTLQWNLGSPWFDKGPLYLWLTALSIKVFGLTSFAVRFWSAAFGVVGCFSVYLIGRKLFNWKVGFMASVILASTLGYLNYSRLGMLDVPNAALNSLSLYFLLLSLENPFFLVPASATLALGFLNRQFLSFLGLAAFLIFLVIQRKYKSYKIRNYFIPLLVFLLITVPWHFVETLKYGKDFWEVYILHQTFSRFSQTIEGKYAPLFWYVTVARTHFRIWFVALLPAIPYFIYKVLKKRPGETLLLIWATLTFVAFTIAKSKLIWYIMPLYPPLSLIVAYFTYSLFQKVKLSLLAPAIVLILACSYNFMTWDRIVPRDFTLDQVRLIEYKNRTDPKADLLTVGYSYSVSSFYSISKVTPIPKEEMRGFFDALGYKYAILTLGDLNSITNKEGYKILYSTGDGALITKSE